MLNKIKREAIYLASKFSQHFLCFWCEFPICDCVCAYSRAKKSVSNDNEKARFKMGKVIQGLAFLFLFSFVFNPSYF